MITQDMIDDVRTAFSQAFQYTFQMNATCFPQDENIGKIAPTHTL